MITPTAKSSHLTIGVVERQTKSLIKKRIIQLCLPRFGTMPAVVTPPAFDAWYRSNYPTLVFNPEWLGACVEYLKVALSLSLLRGVLI